MSVGEKSLGQDEPGREEYKLGMKSSMEGGFLNKMTYVEKKKRRAVDTAERYAFCSNGRIQGDYCEGKEGSGGRGSKRVGNSFSVTQAVSQRGQGKSSCENTKRGRGVQSQYGEKVQHDGEISLKEKLFLKDRAKGRGLNWVATGSRSDRTLPQRKSVGHEKGEKK